jgi:hypothetical protein
MFYGRGIRKTPNAFHTHLLNRARVTRVRLPRQVAGAYINRLLGRTGHIGTMYGARRRTLTPGVPTRARVISLHCV